VDARESSRRRSNLPAITILAFVVVVAAFVGGTWLESVRRQECLDDLFSRDAVLTLSATMVNWSSEWPFRNVERVDEVKLINGRFNDDDVRRLRRALPGAAISYADHAEGQRRSVSVKWLLPDD
jgi:hypothetical protein